MGRRKVCAEKLRKKEQDRRETFSKRCKGLFKKAHELASMCGCQVQLWVEGEDGRLYHLHRLRHPLLPSLAHPVLSCSSMPPPPPPLLLPSPAYYNAHHHHHEDQYIAAAAYDDSSCNNNSMMQEPAVQQQHQPAPPAAAHASPMQLAASSAARKHGRLFYNHKTFKMENCPPHYFAPLGPVATCTCNGRMANSAHSLSAPTLHEGATTKDACTLINTSISPAMEAISSCACCRCFDCISGRAMISASDPGALIPKQEIGGAECYDIEPPPPPPPPLPPPAAAAAQIPDDELLPSDPLSAAVTDTSISSSVIINHMFRTVAAHATQLYGLHYPLPPPADPTSPLLLPPRNQQLRNEADQATSSVNDHDSGVTMICVDGATSCDSSSCEQQHHLQQQQQSAPYMNMNNMGGSNSSCCELSCLSDGASIQQLTAGSVKGEAAFDPFCIHPYYYNIAAGSGAGAGDAIAADKLYMPCDNWDNFGSHSFFLL